MKNESPGNPTTNPCTNCLYPEIRDLGPTLQDAFVHCPPEIRERAKHLLPDHPLVKKIIAEETLEVLHQKERRIGEVQVESAIKEAALYEIYNSGAWKALIKYYRIIRKVFAPNSPSGILARRFLNLVRRSRRGDMKSVSDNLRK